jgi:hypothetical protein
MIVVLPVGIPFFITCFLPVGILLRYILSPSIVITFRQIFSSGKELYVLLLDDLFREGVLFPGVRIRIHFIRIRIQHFRLNTDPDLGL